MNNLDELYSELSLTRFEGQLSDSFQENLQEFHNNVVETECHFYHTLTLCDGRVIPGGWDIQGNENNYQGHIQYDKMRVLEFGAASGYLTFWMGDRGADVVALDLPPGFPPNLVPLPGVDLKANALSGAVTATEVRNSWWFGRRECNSNAKAVYADIYNLPKDLCRFDISTFGSILLHLANPFKALQEASLVTDKAMVITDLIPDIIYGDEGNSLIEFNPGDEPNNLVNWWRVSPAAITKMLKTLGFPYVDIHFFENEYHPYHDPDAPAVSRFMFTAVGQREKDIIPRVEKTNNEIKKDESLRSIIPVINVHNYNEAHRRLKETHDQLKEAHEKLERIYRSFAWKATKPIRILCGIK